jgi:CubicO group peptidase (beta-lactamase class C family)
MPTYEVSVRSWNDPETPEQTARRLLQHTSGIMP